MDSAVYLQPTQSNTIKHIFLAVFHTQHDGSSLNAELVVYPKD